MRRFYGVDGSYVLTTDDGRHVCLFNYKGEEAMTTPPINDKGKTERKPEHPDIVRARADVNNAAAEYEHASQAAAATLRKLQQAQEALAAELAKPRRE